MGNAAPQYIPLKTWAEARYPGCVPHANTLRRWADQGIIQPKPHKRGNVYMVAPDARHVDEPVPAKPSLLDRLKNHGLSPA
ncbi:MAG: hypothetical protein H7255_08815 [Ramlibacter sp.]|nr:hypothetical protein [Ramlibacter sp.]